MTDEEVRAMKMTPDEQVEFARTDTFSRLLFERARELFGGPTLLIRLASRDIEDIEKEHSDG